MSKRKGLSFEEKRTRLLEIFHETKSFYQLKELEKIAPKTKGIISQSVKEVLQSLVDDGLVDTEKIGTSVYFWSFPSKVYNKRKHQAEQLDEQLKSLKKRKVDLDASLAENTVGKEDSEARVLLAQQLQEAQAKEKSIAKELEAYADCNPEMLDVKRQLTRTATEAANRWTDNVFSIRQWVKSKFNMEDDVLNKMFEIPSDFDYIEVQ